MAIKSARLVSLILITSLVLIIITKCSECKRLYQFMPGGRPTSRSTKQHQFLQPDQPILIPVQSVPIAALQQSSDVEDYVDDEDYGGGPYFGGGYNGGSPAMVQAPDVAYLGAVPPEEYSSAGPGAPAVNYYAIPVPHGNQAGQQSTGGFYASRYQSNMQPPPLIPRYEAHHQQAPQYVWGFPSGSQQNKGRFIGGGNGNNRVSVEVLHGGVQSVLAPPPPNRPQFDTKNQQQERRPFLPQIPWLSNSHKNGMARPSVLATVTPDMASGISSGGGTIVSRRYRTQTTISDKLYNISNKETIAPTIRPAETTKPAASLVEPSVTSHWIPMSEKKCQCSCNPENLSEEEVDSASSWLDLTSTSSNNRMTDTQTPPYSSTILTKRSANKLSFDTTTIDTATEEEMNVTQNSTNTSDGYEFNTTTISSSSTQQELNETTIVAATEIINATTSTTTLMTNEKEETTTLLLDRSRRQVIGSFAGGRNRLLQQSSRPQRPPPPDAASILSILAHSNNRLRFYNQCQCWCVGPNI